MLPLIVAGIVVAVLLLGGSRPARLAAPQTALMIDLRQLAAHGASDGDLRARITTSWPRMDEETVKKYIAKARQ